MERDEISKKIDEYFMCPKPRQLGRTIILRTGAGGMDLFNEATDEWMGYKRIYIGNKVPRILRRLKSPIRKSLTKGYYKLWKSTLEHRKEKE